MRALWNWLETSPQPNLIIQAILDNGVSSIAQMAFSISPPGTAPSEQEVRDFYNARVGVNLGTITSAKLLVFQCHILVVANIKSKVRVQGAHPDLPQHSLECSERGGQHVTAVDFERPFLGSLPAFASEDKVVHLKECDDTSSASLPPSLRSSTNHLGASVEVVLLRLHFPLASRTGKIGPDTLHEVKADRFSNSLPFVPKVALGVPKLVL